MSTVFGRCREAKKISLVTMLARCLPHSAKDGIAIDHGNDGAGLQSVTYRHNQIAIGSAAIRKRHPEALWTNRKRVRMIRFVTTTRSMLSVFRIYRRRVDLVSENTLGLRL